MTSGLRFALALLALASLGACRGPDSADLVVQGARVFTADSLQPEAEAFAVTAGTLTYVGTDSGAAELIGEDTRVVDAHGRLITPGFHDTHVHLLQAAAEREWCYLDVPETLEATVANLMTCAEQSRGPWLLANDLNPDVFPPDGPPRGFLKPPRHETRNPTRRRSGTSVPDSRWRCDRCIRSSRRDSSPA